MCFVGQPWILHRPSECSCTHSCSRRKGGQCPLVLYWNRSKSTHLPSPTPGKPLHQGARSVSSVVVGTKPLGSRNPPPPQDLGDLAASASISAAWVAALCLNSPGPGDACTSARVRRGIPWGSAAIQGTCQSLCVWVSPAPSSLSLKLTLVLLPREHDQLRQMKPCLKHGDTAWEDSPLEPKSCSKFSSLSRGDRGDVSKRNPQGKLRHRVTFSKSGLLSSSGDPHQ